MISPFVVSGAGFDSLFESAADSDSIYGCAKKLVCFVMAKVTNSTEHSIILDLITRW